MNEGRRLVQLASAIRGSSLKRLRQVPEGFENWRPSPGSLSLAELAMHLLDADRWLLRKLDEPALEPFVAQADETTSIDRAEFERLIGRLETTGRVKVDRLKQLTSEDLDGEMADARFGGAVETWWVVVRGNLDHEAHHRGQIATYLRMLSESGAWPGFEGRAGTGGSVGER